MQDGWGTPVGPNGGFIAAALLAAIQTLESTRDRLPRTLTLHFVRALRPGPAQIRLVEEQIGRGMTRLSARVVQEDRARVTALAAFAGAYPGAGFGDVPMPDVPAADDVEPIPPADPRCTSARRRRPGPTTACSAASPPRPGSRGSSRRQGRSGPPTERCSSQSLQLAVLGARR